MTRAAIYCRLSFDRAGAGLGVQRQQEDCRELASSLGWEVASVHVDNDTSAYSGKRRPGYEALLRDLESGTADVVLAWHTDRLHRSMVELEHFIDVLNRVGAGVRTVRGGDLDLATPTGRMIARQLAVLARYESEHRGERVARARQQRVADGRYAGGGRAFGWEADGVTLIPREAAVIVEAASAVLSGVSLKAIAQDLQARGVATARGARWSSVALRDMLLRPHNAGLSVHLGEEVGRGRWPAILAEDTYRALVARLKDPERRTNPGSPPRWLGSGLYRCGVPGCPGVLRASTAGDYATRPVYRCNVRGHLLRNAKHLDAFVEAVIVERLSRPDARDLLTQRQEVGTTDLHLEAVAIQGRLEELSSAYADAAITAVQLRSGSERLRRRLEAVQARQAQAAAIDPLAPLVGAEDVSAVWERLDLGRRRAVVDAIITVTVLPAGRGRGFDPTRVRIDWKR